MDIVLYVLQSFTRLILSVVYFSILLRSLFSWFTDEETKLESFLIFITEPFIFPVRAVMAKFNILQDSPIDFSSWFTLLILMLLLMII